MHQHRGRMGAFGQDSGTPKHQREYTSDSGMCVRRPQPPPGRLSSRLHSCSRVPLKIWGGLELEP